MRVEIEIKCPHCKRKVSQAVHYEKKNGDLEITTWWYQCQKCKGFLSKPSIEKVKKAL